MVWELWRLAVGVGDGEGVLGLLHPAAAAAAVVVVVVKYGDGEEAQE